MKNLQTDSIFDKPILNTITLVFMIIKKKKKKLDKKIFYTKASKDIWDIFLITKK